MSAVSFAAPAAPANGERVKKLPADTFAFAADFLRRLAEKNPTWRFDLICIGDDNWNRDYDHAAVTAALFADDEYDAVVVPTQAEFRRLALGCLADHGATVSVFLAKGKWSVTITVRSQPRNLVARAQEAI